MLHEKRKVLLAFGKRGQLDLDHGEPVKEIFAKLFLCNQGAQRPVRRRDDADVDLVRFNRSHALYFLGLHYPQKFGLRCEGHVADLIKE
jgi:hypothetical protein